MYTMILTILTIPLLLEYSRVCYHHIGQYSLYKDQYLLMVEYSNTNTIRNDTTLYYYIVYII